MNEESFKLEILQQPQRARVMGIGERYRRPIEPPPVVKLVVTMPDGTESLEVPVVQSVILHASLLSSDGQNVIDTISKVDRVELFNSFSSGDVAKEERVLLGSLSATCNIVKGLEERKGCYFVFPDLHVSVEGYYRLLFSLMVIPGAPDSTSTSSRVKATVVSDVFQVYSVTDFPGVGESTTLSKTLAQQGVNIPIRNKGRYKS